MTAFSATTMADLTGRRVIVTGANSGLGLQTSIALAAKGAAVTLACRNRERGVEALNILCAETGSLSCEVRTLDLADLESVRSFAAQWEEPLDLLINNAGIMATPQARTKDGFEQQLGVNHLGHFALGGLLLEHLRAASAARVISVSSLAHKSGRIDFADLNSDSSYSRWRAYRQSKIANLYYTVEFNRRLRAKGDDIIAAAAHPGLSDTKLFANTGGLRPVQVAMASLVRLIGQSESAGALPTLYAATAPDVAGGDFYGPDGAGERRGNVALVAPAQKVLDESVARRLWTASEDLTGVQYPDLPPL